MSLTVWDPFLEMESLLNKYQRYNKYNTRGSKENEIKEGDFVMSDWLPLVDITENAESFNLRLELPGVKKEDVTITIENNVLTIKGEKKNFHQDAKKHRTESYYGNFSRSFTLPQAINNEEVKANYENGILYLILPKEEQAKPKQIHIAVN